MDLWPEEARAAAILAVTLNGTIVPRDVPGAPDGSHDFDVETGSGQVAVEVTRLVDDPSLAAARLVQRRDWTCPSLAESWLLNRRPRLPSVKALHREVESLLAVLESRHTRSFEARELDGLAEDAQAAVVRLSDLGIRRGSAIGEVGETATILFGSTSTGSTAPCLVNSAVEARAEAKAAKLAAATATERHLFVWIDSSADPTNAGMGLDILPAESPALPEGMDVAWVAPGPYGERDRRLTSRLWKTTAADGWENIGPVWPTGRLAR